MDRILEEIPLCTVDDEDRFRSILLSAIDRKEIRAYTRFARPDPAERQRRRQQAEAEAKEAEELAKQLGLEDILFETSGGSDSKQRKRKQSREAGEEADEDSVAFAAMKHVIQRRGKDRFDSLIAGLEAKYAITSKPAARSKQSSAGKANKGKK